ncbi:hypothetical protein SAMN06265365_110115 [Tistlia consotensis]|uniref:Bacteriophage CI repressor helix-turn-helix domain-containing protein n=1 Tax=Tistlia consotensis USBA 355 TaxID=560819 RepID=A0A1Y6BSX8_9PROT|nr:hypothetical protein [Tistlia consotensis]SMF26934.1 hypothetical protein SAMN05428998_10941 [Tistlia consotensis USBA 355]SNR66680.1 hypothetical protein SAMN06265365_110115 [Tistlia consotensis]
MTGEAKGRTEGAKSAPAKGQAARRRKTGPRPKPVSAEEAVPGWTPAFGERFAELIDAVGGYHKAADLTGLQRDTLSRHARGKAKTPLHSAQILCETAGVSLDWLATGERAHPGDKAAGTTFPEGFVNDAEQAWEVVEAAAGQLSAARKARVFAYLLGQIAEGRALGLYGSALTQFLERQIERALYLEGRLQRGDQKQRNIA